MHNHAALVASNVFDGPAKNRVEIVQDMLGVRSVEAGRGRSAPGFEIVRDQCSHRVAHRRQTGPDIAQRRVGHPAIGGELRTPAVVHLRQR